MRQYYRVWCGLLLPVTVMLGGGKGWGLTAIDGSSLRNELISGEGGHVNPLNFLRHQLKVPVDWDIASQGEQAPADLLDREATHPQKSPEVCEDSPPLTSSTVEGPIAIKSEEPIAIKIPGRTLSVRIMHDANFLTSDLSQNEIQAFLENLAVARSGLQDQDGFFTQRDLDHFIDEIPSKLSRLYQEKGYITVEAKLDSQKFSTQGHLLIKLTNKPIEIKTLGASLYLNFKTSAVFTTNEIKDWLEKDFHSPQEQVATEVEKSLDRLYLENGYITTQVKVTPETSGFFSVEVLEGRLGKIEPKAIKNGIPQPDLLLPSRLQSYICSRIRLGESFPLNQYKLESQLRLLNHDPLFDSIEGILKKPENQPSDENQPKKSDLEVRFVPARRRWMGGITFDNLSPPSVGSVRLLADLRYLSPLGYGRLGDDLSVSYYRSMTGGNEGLDVSYRALLNPMNGTLLLRATPSRSEVTQREFRGLGIRGKSQLYEISYRQPLQRTFNDEFALSLGLTYQNGQTFLFDQLPFPFGKGPDAEGVSRTSVLTLGQDYLHRYKSGVWLFNSQFRLGTGLFDATTNESSVPDGQFFSWLGQVQWVQRWAANQTMVTQAAWQLTPNSLLPSQQCVIGGGRSVRGYRQNARSGDNCLRLSSEYQIGLGFFRTSSSRKPNESKQKVEGDNNLVTTGRDKAPIVSGRNRDYPENELKLMLAPFWDMGMVWNNSDNPNGLPPGQFLTSVGIGLMLEERPVTEREARWSLRVDYGLPLVDSAGGSSDLQDAGVFFSFRYRL